MDKNTASWEPLEEEEKNSQEIISHRLKVPGGGDN
jgi:hypothetical protein